MLKLNILVNFSDFNGFKRAHFNRLTSSTGLKKSCAKQAQKIPLKIDIIAFIRSRSNVKNT